MPHPGASIEACECWPRRFSWKSIWPMWTIKPKAVAVDLRDNLLLNDLPPLWGCGAGTAPVATSACTGGTGARGLPPKQLHRTSKRVKPFDAFRRGCAVPNLQRKPSGGRKVRRLAPEIRHQIDLEVRASPSPSSPASP